MPILRGIRRWLVDRDTLLVRSDDLPVEGERRDHIRTLLTSL